MTPPANTSGTVTCARRNESESESGDESPVSPLRDGAPEQLRLLADDYALTILQSLSEGPKRGRELLDDCDGARSTVYGRLNRLVDAGLVDAETTLDPNGHHCKTFRLVRDTLRVTVQREGIEVVSDRRRN